VEVAADEKEQLQLAEVVAQVAQVVADQEVIVLLQELLDQIILVAAEAAVVLAKVVEQVVQVL